MFSPSLSSALVSSLLLPLWAGVLGLVVSAVLLPLLMRVARRQGWVVWPRKDRWHQKPTALLGGVGIYLGWMGALIATGTRLPIWMLAGATLLLIVGAVDDVRELNPMQKLFAQIVAAVLPLVAGIAFGDRLPTMVAVPLTLFWVVGITNALNLIDGMDGLAGGVAAIAAGILGVSALVVGDAPAATVAFALAGACGGFLIYNFHPARVFMGDGGSLMLGYTLAALALRVQQLGEASTDRLVLLALPIAVLAVPIFDTSLVTVMRTLHGRPVTQGGNDHLMHRLVHLGLSERRTVVLLYGVSLIYGGLALGLLLLKPALAAALGGLVAMITIAVGFNVAAADVYETRERFLDPVERSAAVRWGTLLQRTAGREWKAMFGLAIDLVLMSAVAVFAFALHDGRSTVLARGTPSTLALLLAAKLVVFYVGGLYRGIWRYAGTPELVRVFTVGVAATCASGVLASVLPGIQPVAAPVLVTDAFLTVAALAAVRFGLRGGRQFISAHRAGGRRVLLYGAGDGGLLMLREIRQNADYGFRAVGFLDDDPFKYGMQVQGVPVHGGLKTLRETCQQARADLVLITVRRITPARRRAIVEACVQAGVECRALSMQVETLHVPGAFDLASASAN